MKRLVSSTAFSGFAAASLILATISLGASPSLAEQGSGSHIGMGAKTCLPAPGADCSKVKHRWKFEHHGDLTGVNFAKAHLHGANLQDATLKKANFSQAKLHKARFHRANLNGAVFDGSGMKMAMFYDAKLKNASFRGANLAGAHFGFSASPAGGTLARNSSDACKSNPSAGCKGAVLTGADFTGANLVGADFSGALIGGATFANANLTNANFTGASTMYLDGTMFMRDVGHYTPANFSGARMDGAVFTDTFLPYSNFSNISAQRVIFSGSYIARINVTATKLPDANFTGACAFYIDTDASDGVDLTGALVSPNWFSNDPPCYTRWLPQI